MYISKSLNFRIVFSESCYQSDRACFELIMVEILSKKSKILIRVLYVPPSSEISYAENTITELIVQYNEVILMGNLNNDVQDRRLSEGFSTMAYRNNLTIIHNNTPTHFDSYHGSYSLLDVFLVILSYKKKEYEQFYIPASISKHSLITLRYEFDVMNRENTYLFRDNFSSIKYFS